MAEIPRESFLWVLTLSFFGDIHGALFRSDADASTSLQVANFSFAADLKAQDNNYLVGGMGGIQINADPVVIRIGAFAEGTNAAPIVLYSADPAKIEFEHQTDFGAFVEVRVRFHPEEAPMILSEPRSR